jgi:hypothetical protein
MFFAIMPWPMTWHDHIGGREIASDQPVSAEVVKWSPGVRRSVTRKNCKVSSFGGLLGWGVNSCQGIGKLLPAKKVNGKQEIVCICFVLNLTQLT